MSNGASHKGWHSRGYLPHLDLPDLTQAITFRLADSLPNHVIAQWKEELAESSNALREKTLRKKIADFEDAGHGSCFLRDPNCAEMVQQALLHSDNKSYRLLEWCVMPNHVHVMIHTHQGFSLGKIVGSWKSYSATQINAHLGRAGKVWAVDYHDRYIRDLEHYENAKSYVRKNPVKAGLCAKPEDFPWSSAGWPDCESPGSRD